MYRWKEGSRCKGDATVVAESLEAIRQRHHGRLFPVEVVEEARPTTSPLHPEFEWDDTVAAHEYRKEQARGLIRSVIFVQEGAPAIRAFVAVVQEDDQAMSYTHVLHAMESPALKSQVLERAKHDLLDWEQRYHSLEEFATVHHAINQL